ncbi:hypothetical protein AB1N83_011962, partial [Pleurotus pulmonarius]
WARKAYSCRKNSPT